MIGVSVSVELEMGWVYDWGWGWVCDWSIIKRLVGLVTRGCNTASGNFSCLWTTESSISFK